MQPHVRTKDVRYTTATADSGNVGHGAKGYHSTSTAYDAVSTNRGCDLRVHAISSFVGFCYLSGGRDVIRLGFWFSIRKTLLDLKT